MQIYMLYFNARTCTYFTCSPQCGWRYGTGTVSQKSCRLSVADSSQQLSFTTRRDRESTAIIPSSGLGISCLSHSSQCSSHSISQTPSRGSIQACTDPDSQMKHCVNSLGGRAQSCSLVLSQRLARSGSEHQLPSFVCKA